MIDLIATDMYIWHKTPNLSEHYWRMEHTDRLQITETKHREYRVWDSLFAYQVCLVPSLKEAIDKAELYHQVFC